MQIQILDPLHPRHTEVGTLVDSESLHYLMIKFPDGKTETFEIHQCQEAGVWQGTESLRKKIEIEYRRMHTSTKGRKCSKSQK